MNRLLPLLLVVVAGCQSVPDQQAMYGPHAGIRTAGPNPPPEMRMRASASPGLPGRVIANQLASVLWYPLLLPRQVLYWGTPLARLLRTTM